MQKDALPLVVTGAAGFIGARIVEHCNARGIPVISVDARGHFTNRPEHAGLNFGTIVDRDEFFGWFEKSRPQVRGILHIGARTDTAELDDAVLERLNTAYTKSMWELCTRERLPLVYASSAATYGDGENGFSDDPAGIPKLKPLNPYGWSKQRFDLWALDQARAGQMPPQWSGFKFFNVYGYGERHKKRMASVVLHSFDQVNRNGVLTLFKSHRPGIADGHQKRDFIFVGDLVKVLFFALEKPIQNGIYNLGSGEARTFLDLARAVFRAMGRPEKIEFVDTPEVFRARYQYFTQADMTRLREAGFREAFTSLEEGVRKSIARIRPV